MEVISVRKIKIINPGLLTTIQDLGRWGYQRYGMSVAGSMDHFSTRVANWLVGNDENEAVLEATMMSPEIQFLCDEVISITGANMKPKINGEPVPMWTSLLVRADDKLSFSASVSGIRTYIAFSTGIDVPQIMNSKATFLKGKVGGLEGRKLAKEDELPLGNKIIPDSGSYLPIKFNPEYKNDDTIRVVLGPQDDYFSKEAIDTFLNSEYKITSEADRMGYRLDGEKIEHIEGADIISDGIVFGSVQVPGHGSPIIMMADRQTTGGYTKIATVITPDLSKLAQMKPGGKVKFERVSIEEAQNIYREYENKMSDIKSFINDNRFEFRGIRKMNFRIGEKTFNVDIREL